MRRSALGAGARLPTSMLLTSMLLTSMLLGPGLLGLAGPVQAAEVQIESPRFTVDRETGIQTYEDARLTLGRLTLFASRMQVNANTGRITASGFLRLQTPTVTGTADRLELDATSGSGRLWGADLLELKGRLYLRAEQVRFDRDGKLELEGSSLTSCAPGTPGAWRITAQSVTLEPDGLGVAWGPRLDVGAVPILWLPVLAWPTVAERRTGVLQPRLSRQSSSLERFDLGWRLTVPVFVNLGFDHDLTLTPEVVEQRGTALGLEYNYAFWERQSGRLTLWGLKERHARDPGAENDVLSPQGLAPPEKPLARYRADWAHNQALGDDGRLVLSWHQSSDGQVRREYDGISGLRPYQTYQASLSNQWDWVQAALTFEQNADFSAESVYVTERAQTDIALRPQLRPRATAEVGGRLDSGVPITAAAGLGAAAFRAEAATSGRLTRLSPTLSLPLALGGAFELRPTLTRHMVHYGGLTRPGTGDGVESLPDAGFSQTEGTVELRTALARVFELEDSRYAALKHQLVPRLLYTVVEDVPQPLADQLLRARVAQRLVTLRLDTLLLGKVVRSAAAAPNPAEDLLAGTEPDAEASLSAVAAPGRTLPAAPFAAPRTRESVSELLRVDLIQRYNLLLDKDAPALIGPASDTRPETEPGEPLLPLLLDVSASVFGFTAAALLNWNHQLHRGTHARVSMRATPAPRAALGLAYEANEYAYATPDNKRVPELEALSLDFALGLGESWTVGSMGRANLKPNPPLNRRMDHVQAFVEYKPRCYLFRLGYTESVVPVRIAGKTEYALDRRYDVTLDLSGLIGGAGAPHGSGYTAGSSVTDVIPPRGNMAPGLASWAGDGSACSG